MAKAVDKSVTTITVNTEHYHVMSTHMCMGTLLIPHVNTLKYMSADALIQLIDGCADLLIEAQLVVRQASTAKETARDFRAHKDQVMERPSWIHERPAFRERLMTFICEYVLRSEGIGRLTGFTTVNVSREEGSMVTQTKNSLANPETTLIWK